MRAVLPTIRVFVLVFGLPVVLSGCGGSNDAGDSGAGGGAGDSGAAASCGDGVKQAGEGCDGTDFGAASCASFGFPGGSLGCLPNCEVESTGCDAPAGCGDGTVEGAEICDGDNMASQSCTRLGYDGGVLACQSNCAGFDTAGCDRAAVCGDNLTDGAESCDGNDRGGATCRSLGFDGGALTCRSDCSGFDTSACFGTSECGNGQVDVGEACDGGLLVGTSCQSLGFSGGQLACASDCAAFDLSNCSAPPACGNGVRNGAEQCDGNDVAGATCQSLGFDAGTLNCAANCAFDTSACQDVQQCGDGVREGAELCDGLDLDGQSCVGLGQPAGLLRCSATCTFDTVGCTGAPGCGNGIVDGSEVCDPPDFDGLECAAFGFNSGEPSCAADCSSFELDGCFNASCGDGLKEGTEVCDSSDLGGHNCATEGFDAGTLLCASDCRGFDTGACVEYPICGNDIREASDNEACDGLDLNGETCQSQGFLTGTLRCRTDCGGFNTNGCVVANVCGNGVRENNEVCDGDDLRGFDCASVGFDAGTLRCSANCDAFNTNACFNSVCGDGTAEGGEACDGNDLSGESCLSLGLGAGVLGCSPGCASFDTSGCPAPPVCGNGTIEGNERCDGGNLALESCLTLGLGDGPLGCLSDCSDFDRSGCCEASCNGRQCGPDPQCPDVSCGACFLESCGATGQCDGDACGLFECTLGLATACTCSSADPCGWQNDGMCNSPCADLFPNDHFDDAMDCTCGNAQLDAREVCDIGEFGNDSCAARGYAQGDLACSTSCLRSFEQACTGFGSCGNGVVDGDELCDGDEFAPGMGPGCSNLSFLAYGPITCNSDCTLDVTQCTDFLGFGASFCAISLNYDDERWCDACDLMGGSYDSDCSTVCGSDGQCGDYFDSITGVWTCWHAGYGLDPDCSY